MFQKVVDSWMDIVDLAKDTTNINYQGYINFQNQQVLARAQLNNDQNPVYFDPEHPDTLKGYNEGLRTKHRQRFPINDHLMVLMFIVASDLTKFQRRDITSNQTQQGIKLQDYTCELIAKVFRDLLCSTKTGINDTYVRPTGIGTGEGIHHDAAPSI